MLVFTTDALSYTGNIIYSDWFVPGKTSSLYPEKKPFLNRWAAKPIIGLLAGVTRLVISIIHIFIHLIAFVATKNKGHLYHVVKGSTELLRGVIESIPLVKYLLYICLDPLPKKNSAASFFITKIVNPKNMDGIDHHFNLISQ